MTKKSKDALQARRAEQIEELDKVLVDLRRKTTILKEKQRKHVGLLISAVKGHYEEMDKLSKKAPAEKVTDLALGEVNYTIEETKKLLGDDMFINRLNVFVAAGENPELRDVVLVLRQLLQGLSRFDADLKPQQDRLADAIKEAVGLKEVLTLYVQEGYEAEVSDSRLRHSTRESLPKDWWQGHWFWFDRLDDIDIQDYFKERVE